MDKLLGIGIMFKAIVIFQKETCDHAQKACLVFGKSVGSLIFISNKDTISCDQCIVWDTWYSPYCFVALFFGLLDSQSALIKSISK